jgi:hypothetical protein
MDYQTLDDKIGGLESRLGSFCIGKSQRDYKWECVFNSCREIQEGFNSKPRYPTKEQREVAWVRFNDLRSRAHNEHREYRKDESYEVYKELMHDLSLADHNLGDIIAEATFLAFDKTDVDDMKRKGQTLRDVRQKLKENNKVLIHEHQNEIWNKILTVQSNQDAWWGKWKERRGQRHEEYLAKSKKHEEWLERQAQWKKRVQENISKNQEKLDKAESALMRSQTHADELREKIATARSDDYRERVEGWLEEEETRSKSIEESIERIKSWIEEDEQKLNE